MKKIFVVPLAASLVLTAIAGTAIGDGHADKALQAAIAARQAQMKLVSFNTAILGDMAKGVTPYDSATASAAAANLEAVAKLDRSILWLEGSVQGTVDGTRAKAEIWSDAAGFDKAATALETAAAAMAQAAGTDQAALQAAMGDLGGTCSTCHKAYRGPKN
ncbi:cytochrome c [Roseobacter sp. YSTF-M11]|uniref:Cytochrome c n=1 Tax=Roseobacter insulae TaxID=2859783 RepID=A0A9X1FW84_9RHOB|nr:cytochrome c [Roseobacter insulae]MBW4708813.1 cytochrome c [Roseobacter insulae]